jgi:hypothetical protein
MPRVFLDNLIIDCYRLGLGSDSLREEMAVLTASQALNVNVLHTSYSVARYRSKKLFAAYKLLKTLSNDLLH